MPRGHEDWGVSASAENASPDLPTAELAARLGALSLYDQTGQLMFADGFEHGLAPYSIDTQGTGTAKVLTAGHSFLGGYSLRLTGGSDGLRYARCSKNFPRPFLTRWGIEARVVLPAGAGQLHVDIRRYDGTTEHKYELLLDLTTQGIRVLQSDGSYATVTTNANYNNGPDIWHPLKLVVDLDADAWVRLGFATGQYDLSTYSHRDTPNASASYIAMTIGVDSDAGANPEIELDSVIYTYNEP